MQSARRHEGCFYFSTLSLHLVTLCLSVSQFLSSIISLSFRFLCLFFNAYICFSFSFCLSLSFIISFSPSLPFSRFQDLVFSRFLIHCLSCIFSLSMSYLSMFSLSPSISFSFRICSLSVPAFLAPCFLQGTAWCISQYLSKPEPSSIPATQVRETFLYSVLKTGFNKFTDSICTTFNCNAHDASNSLTKLKLHYLFSWFLDRLLLLCLMTNIFCSSFFLNPVRGNVFLYSWQSNNYFVESMVNNWELKTAIICRRIGCSNNASSLNRWVIQVC